MKRLLAAAIALGLAIGAGGVIATQLNLVSWFGDSPETGPSALAAEDKPQSSPSFADDKPREVSALGHLEPADGVLNVSSPLLGERIEEISVVEGQSVEVDQQLVQLNETFLILQRDLAREAHSEAQRRLDAERLLAETRLEAAELAVKQAAEGMKAQVEAQKTQLQSLQKNREQAQIDLARIKTLTDREDPLASPQQLEHQALLLAKADAEISAAEAALARLNQTTRFQQETADAERNLALAGSQAAKDTDPTGTLAKQLEIAEHRLAQATIHSPAKSVVLKLFARAGEFVAQKPILQLAELDKMICVAEVFDGDIKHVSLEQPVHIRSRAFAGDYESTYVKGTVKRIGNMVKTPELQRLDPYAPVDRHVIEVRIQLDDVEKAARYVNESANALVNLQVEVTFLVEDSS